MTQLSDGEVTLRPLNTGDIPRLAVLANNENISVNLRDAFPNPYTEEDAKAFIRKVTDSSTMLVFAIEFKGEYTGNISLLLGSDVYRKSAEIGYFLGEPFWNKGIMTKAINLITKYGFEQLHLIRIHCGVFEYNLASQRVLDKCRYQKEGVSRKAIVKKGKIWNEIRYAKTRSD